MDSPSVSLTNSALAQLILKIAYFLKDNSLLTEIKNKLREVLGVKINDAKVTNAIRQLVNEKKIECRSNKIIISGSCRNSLDKAKSEYNKRYEEVVKKYFERSESDFSIVKGWFEDVTILFLEQYFYAWIGKLTKDPRISNAFSFDLQKIFDQIFRSNNKIQPSDHEWLKQQYYQFLYSEDYADNALLWDFGTSLFSATLITANLSADQLSINLFENSKIILDTNILLEIQLEGSKYSTIFKDLGDVLNQLGIELYYFHITSEEYRNKLIRTKDALKKVIENYSSEIIKDTDDIFLQTAISRGCKQGKDITRFIDQLLELPKHMTNFIPINLIDYKELETQIDIGTKNEKLKNDINSLHQKLRGKNKHKNSLIHDAGLITGTDFLREQDKWLILTLDKTLICYAIENIIRDENPLVIGLDTLINILAINNGGTDVDPSNFAPLFAKIIKMGLTPQKSLFKVEDLSFLLDSHLQIKALPNDSIKIIVKKLNNKRLSGLPDDKIALELRRDIETEKLKLQDDLNSSKKAQELVQGENKDLKMTLSKLKSDYSNKLKGDLRDKYDKKILTNKIVFFIILPIITTFITLLIIYINNSQFSDSWKAHLIGLLINALFWIFTSIFLIKPKIVKKYSDRITKIDEEIENKLNEYNVS